MNNKYIKYKNKYINIKQIGSSNDIINDHSIQFNNFFENDTDYKPFFNMLSTKNIFSNNSNNSDIINIIKSNPILIYEIIMFYKKSEEKIINYFLTPINIDLFFINNSISLFELLIENELYEQIKKYDISLIYSDINKLKIFYNIILSSKYINNFKKLIEYDILPEEFKTDSKYIIYRLLNDNLINYLTININPDYISEIKTDLGAFQLSNTNIIHLYNDLYIMEYFMTFLFKNLILLNILLNNTEFRTFELFNTSFDINIINENDIHNDNISYINIIIELNNSDIIEFLILKGLLISNNNLINIITNTELEYLNIILIKHINISEPIEILNILSETSDCETIESREMPIYSITELDIDFYHGTYNKINDYKLNVPTFYSLDILQSLGHVLIRIYSYIKYISNYPNFELDFHELNYYPVIYIYNNKEIINLLVLENTWYKDFTLLYNPQILYKHLIKHDDIVNIIYNFCVRLDGEKTLFTEKEYFDFFEFFFNNLIKILHYKDNIEAEIINYTAKFYINLNLYYLLKIYSESCTKNCFGSFLNIGGYELLTKIDYNQYFDDIGIKDPGYIIDGIYVPNDQDEIILLNNDKLQIKDIIYITPYTYKDKSNEEKINYIREYIRLQNNFKTNITNTELFINFFQHYLQLIKINDMNHSSSKSYTKINKNKDENINIGINLIKNITLYNSWYFDYFSTYYTFANPYINDFIFDFDPHTHEIIHNTDAEDLHCYNKLIPTNQFMYKHYTNKNSLIEYNYTNDPRCKKKVTKISIYKDNENDKLGELSLYINYLLTESTSQILFSNNDFLDSEV